MLGSSKFARAAYALFGIAVLAALLKLGGISGAEPVVLRTVPSTPVAKAEEAAATREVSRGERLTLPDTERVDAGRVLTKAPPISPVFSGDAPVFYRPSPAAPAREADEGSGEPVCGDLGDFPKSSRAVFPLPNAYFNSYDDTWGAPRPQGGHEGSDLMSPTGTPEFAITDGTLVPVAGSNRNGWNRLGGYTVMLKAAYDIGPIKKGDLFYYAHMDRESALPIGTKVRAGQQIGVVGDTGEGTEGTRGKFPPHLHLGWYDTDPDNPRTNLESGAMNPFPLLLWLKENGGTVAGGTDAAYCEAPQEPIPEPSTGEDHWLTPDLPGTRPDLDTGDAYDARPSPIVKESRHDHDRSPAQESEPDEEDGSREPGGQTDATGEGSNEDLVAIRSESDDETEDDRDETSVQEEEKDEPAASEDRSSPPSETDGSPQAKIRKKTRSALLASFRLRPDLGLRPSYASLLTDESSKTKTKEDRDDKDLGKDRDERDSGTPDKKKKKQKKPPDPPERKEPTKKRLVPKTDAAPARLAPGRKDAGDAPNTKKDSERGDVGKDAPPAPPPGRHQQPKDE